MLLRRVWGGIGLGEAGQTSAAICHGGWTGQTGGPGLRGRMAPMGPNTLLVKGLYYLYRQL
jgi:hypothetical protein